MHSIGSEEIEDNNIVFRDFLKVSKPLSELDRISETLSASD